MSDNRASLVEATSNRRILSDSSVPSWPFVQDDGRVNLNLDRWGTRTHNTSDRAHHLLKTLGGIEEQPSQSLPELPGTQRAHQATPDLPVRLNIVIQVIGSRGDIQPFVALGNELQKHGHRVRIATHDVFKSFVRDAHLEFFPVGGDPTELLAYMVRNPGLIPSIQSLKAGDVKKKRVMMAAMLRRFWLSCIEPDPESLDPFVADSIIANPPSFAHVHCAQALGVPLHMMFTMPWSSTSAFPHPLVNISAAGRDMSKTSELNYLSYGVVEFLTWQGLGGVINEWRTSLDLEPIFFSEGPRLAETLKIPFTYCWSPALVPKPHDWGAHIDICGFFFRQAPPYEPSKRLAEFLATGPRPIYIGFGSIVIDDPARLSEMLFEALRITQTRAVISRGWSKLDGPESDQVMFLDDCPHEWLFQQVTAVIHHGGAGTTACGLSQGKPTAIVPFFGDQPFWGHMVAEAGAGPRPIPQKEVTVDKLVQAITYCQSPEASRAASIIADNMRSETGVRNAVASFHSHLPRDVMECEVLQGQPAAWTYKKGQRRIKLSTAAAEVLSCHLKLDRGRLERLETSHLVIRKRHWDPFSATVAAAFSTVIDVLGAATRVVTRPAKTFSRRHGDDEESKLAICSDGENHAPEEHATPSRGFLSLTGGYLFALFGALGTLIFEYCASVAIILFAFTEGLRSLGKLVGQDTRYIGEVCDMESGVVLGSLLVFFMIYDTVVGLFLIPYKSVKHSGPLGLITGLIAAAFTGLGNLMAVATGIGAYPLLGVYKSVRHAIKRETRESIRQARISEGLFAARHLNLNHQQVMAKFAELTAQQETSFLEAVLGWTRKWPNYGHGMKGV